MVEDNDIDSDTLKQAETLQGITDKYTWYHTIQVADGVYTKSGVPQFKVMWDFILKSMDNIDFQDKKVLDIGCRDGLFSFEAERRGATEVIGLDNDISKGADEFLIPLFGSKVQMHELNLYDLTPDKFGLFDVILCFGVLYHLRYPFWGLKKVTDCLSDKGILLIESGMLVGPTYKNKDFLYCPVEESPYEPTSCAFFNRKGLSTTMRSLKLELLDHWTMNRAKTTSRVRLVREFAKKIIRYWTRSCDVTREFLIFKKDVRLQLILTGRKHVDIDQYWNSVHETFKAGEWAPRLSERDG